MQFSFNNLKSCLLSFSRFNRKEEESSNCRKFHKYSRGLTLIELIIYMGLFSMFVTVLVQLFASSIETRLDAEGTSNANLDANYLLLHFEDVIHNATDITDPTLYGTPQNSLSITVDGDEYEYSLQDGNIIQTVDGTSTQVNSWGTTITNLSFERMRNSAGLDSVRISATVESVARNHNGPEIRTLQTTVGMRN